MSRQGYFSILSPDLVLITETKGLKMDKILTEVNKYKNITERDRQLAIEYIDWYGIEESEYAEYADSFFKECYELVYDSEFGVETIKKRETMPWDK